MHLIHWQYWWWFWFTFLLTLYYVFFMRFFFFRSLKFNPKITTSYRSHGKWGDLIICILPISWCLNILSNSTTLLKLLEWQHEANFFTLRVRGKQWYWVYKFDFKSLIENLYTHKLYKQIGNFSYHQHETESISNNFYVLYNSFLKNKYSTSYEDKLPENYSDNNSQPSKDYVNEWLIELLKSDDPCLKEFQSVFASGMNIYPGLELPEDFVKWVTANIPQINEPLRLPNGVKIEDLNLNVFNCKNYCFFKKNLSESTGFFYKKSNYLLNELSINRFSRDFIFTSNSVDLLKSKNFDFFPSSNNTINLLKLRYTHNTVKPFNNNFYLVLKQKPISDWSKFDASTNFTINGDYSDFVASYSDSFIFNDTEKIQYYNNMRLLRLNKMLFLPVNMQISVITNSFDVIHSWFIPGLGLKMDCVPGRSTHHTLYIDLPGIYYGQCAEICGRFHHHMPIRVCALDLEHYLLWFNHYVLPSFSDLDLDKSNGEFYENLKYLF